MISRIFIVLWLFVLRLSFLVSWNLNSWGSGRLTVSGARPAFSSTGSSTRSMVPNNSNDNHETENGIQCPSPPSSSTTVVKKRLVCIRHGISVANEWMSRPGNEWGDPNFRDDGKADSPLSERGRQKTQEFLQRQFQNPKLMAILDEVELILVSPLTRCLETFHFGVQPLLQRKQQQQQNLRNIPIMAHPLLRERVYTTSDTGRPAFALAREFPMVDFSCCPWEEPWWYVGEGSDENDTTTEWRPNGQNQWYAVPGEPEDVFEERMKELDEWLGNRPEKTILIVTHWGVLRHLTNGTQFLNAEARILEHNFCPVQRRSVVSHIGC